MLGYLPAVFQVDPNYSRSTFCNPAVDRVTSYKTVTSTLVFNTRGEKKEIFGEILTYVFELRELVLTRTIFSLTLGIICQNYRNIRALEFEFFKLYV